MQWEINIKRYIKNKWFEQTATKVAKLKQEREYSELTKLK